MKSMRLLIVLACLLNTPLFAQSGEEHFVPVESVSPVIEELVTAYGEEERDRVQRGVRKTARFWNEEDGSVEAFRMFCLENYTPAGEEYSELIRSVDGKYETLYGHLHEIRQSFEAPFLVAGKATAVDSIFKKSVPGVDPYAAKLAHFMVLNFPAYSLKEKIEQGPSWSREEWAAALLGDKYDTRIDWESVQQEEKYKISGSYVNDYFIMMDKVLTPGMTCLFPDDLKLVCHYSLRDYLKGQYANPDKELALKRQRIILRIMERIVDQSIPAAVVGKDGPYWEPFSNKVYEKKDSEFVEISTPSEGAERYKVLVNKFRSEKAKDPYFPLEPTFIHRRFKSQQMPVEQVEKLLIRLLESPQAAETGKLLAKRLGRPLEPFDIWYNGFSASQELSSDELNRIVKKKYPTSDAYKGDMSRFLQRVGFPEYKADLLSSRIVVEPVRAGGHVSGVSRRGGNSHLRTVFHKDGMDFKSYRVGAHEVGHAVHFNLALYNTDYRVLGDLPTAAFKEAVAELFAYRDLQMLGLDIPDNPTKKYEQALASFWYAFEHSAISLADIYVWKWLYAHPDATAEEARDATLQIAQDVWNRYCAPVYGVEDVRFFGVHSHFISGALYLNSYALGSVVMYQLYDYMEGKPFAQEVERICSIGKITPDLWMQRAVGSPVSVDVMLRGVDEALKHIKE